MYDVGPDLWNVSIPWGQEGWVWACTVGSFIYGKFIDLGRGVVDSGLASGGWLACSSQHRQKGHWAIALVMAIPWHDWDPLPERDWLLTSVPSAGLAGQGEESYLFPALPSFPFTPESGSDCTIQWDHWRASELGVRQGGLRNTCGIWQYSSWFHNKIFPNPAVEGVGAVDGASGICFKCISGSYLGTVGLNWI